eukprot:8813857-Pyramimonas_sp.AAC.1
MIKWRCPPSTSTRQSAFDNLSRAQNEPAAFGGTAMTFAMPSTNSRRHLPGIRTLSPVPLCSGTSASAAWRS